MTNSEQFIYFVRMNKGTGFKVKYKKYRKYFLSNTLLLLTKYFLALQYVQQLIDDDYAFIDLEN